MYRRILAAVNEHVNSEVAARYAMHLAKAAGAKLYLCSIAERARPEQRDELGREAATRLFHRAKELEIEVECLFDWGDPVLKIRELARRDGMDLVFIATRREDVGRRFYAGGTVARGLLRSLPCSLALTRVVHLGRTHPHELLVPLKERIDHVPERAFFTAMLARAFDARVHLFHSTKPVRNFFHGETHLTPVEWEKKVPADISRFVGHLDQYGVEHEKRLSPGKAGKSIAIEAASRRRDLIIMGASGRSALDVLLRGSPAEEVLRDTPCNLIILRPGK
jgi:nucleotide-binding universal stress UspA family protein